MQRWSIIPIEQKVFSVTRDLGRFEKRNLDNNEAKILSYNLSLNFSIKIALQMGWKYATLDFRRNLTL